jgi:hypothetical protein
VSIGERTPRVTGAAGSKLGDSRGLSPRPSSNHSLGVFDYVLNWEIKILISLIDCCSCSFVYR